MSDSQTSAAAIGRRVLQAESDALRLQAEALGPAFAQAVEILASVKGCVVCTGVGKSGHVARKMASTFSSIGTRSFFVHPGEASHGDLGMIDSGDVVIVASKSGEAAELADVITYAKRLAVPLIAITEAVDSTLGRQATVCLPMVAVPEATAEVTAPTTSAVVQMALGDALAVALLEARGFTASDFRVLHPGGKIGSILMTVRDLMHGPENLPLVTPETPMQKTLLAMTGHGWGMVIVVDPHGQMLGVITDGDLRRHMDGLMQHTAGEVMTKSPKWVAPEMLASAALHYMTEPAPPVTVLPVLQQGRPVGVLHVHHLLKAGIL